MRLWISLILTLSCTDIKMIGHLYFMFGDHFQAMKICRQNTVYAVEFLLQRFNDPVNMLTTSLLFIVTEHSYCTFQPLRDTLLYNQLEAV